MSEPATNVHSHPSRAKGLRPLDPSNHARAARFHAGLTGTTYPDYPASWAPPQVPVWPMDLNDSIGCCVVAAVDHFLQAQAAYYGVPRTNWTSKQIVALYRTQNPDFDPAGGRTTGPGSPADGGMNIQTFLEHLVATGDIVAFAAVDQTNQAELDCATWLGLGAITGVTVDQAQMSSQFDAGVWDYVKGSPEDGGHCIPLVARPSDLVCITWGKPVLLTGAFIRQQMSEAWFVLTAGAIAHPGFRNAYDLKAFAEAVSTVTAGKVVVPVPPVPVEPPPAPPIIGPGAASFPVADDLVAHIAAASFRARVTPAMWLDHRLRSYFRMPQPKPGDVLSPNPDTFRLVGPEEVPLPDDLAERIRDAVEAVLSDHHARAAATAAAVVEEPADDPDALPGRNPAG